MESKKEIEMPKFEIDKSLDRLKGKNLFPEQLKRANEFIAKHGLPKEYYRSQGIAPPDTNS